MSVVHPGEAGVGRARAAWTRRQSRAADGVLQAYARGLSTRPRPGASATPRIVGQTLWDRVWLADRWAEADARRRAAGVRPAFGCA